MGFVDDTAVRVELTIPMRAEFVSIARLTASGIANRVGFNIDDIEDIKVALSEICNRLIGVNARFCADADDMYCRLVFVIHADGIVIEFHTDPCLKRDSFILAGMDESGYQDGSFEGFVYSDGDVEGSEDDYADQLWFPLIKLLMDEVTLRPDDECLVTMKKNLG